MNARAYWLGPEPLIAAEVVERAGLPAALHGALVVQPTPLTHEALTALQHDVAQRGGRLAVELGDEAPSCDGSQGPFQFSRAVAGDDELRRELTLLLEDPALLVPPSACFRFQSFRLVELVAHAVSAFLPSPGKRIVGLVELLMNACEHGSLSITRHEKQALLASGRWMQELERRASEPPWCTRVVEAAVDAGPEGWVVTITDQGEGFDASGPVQAGLLHGRGLRIARQLSFDSVEFEGRGNRVVAKVARR